MVARGSSNEVGQILQHRSLCRRVGLLVCLGLLCTSGCAHLGNWLHNGFKVGPDYCEPAVSVAGQWIDFNSPSVISEANGVDEANWWRNFNDPVMDELVLTAYQQNLPLRVAGLRVLEAERQRAIAAGELFPQFQEAFGNFQQTQRSPTGFSSGLPAAVRSLGIWSAGFRASWELDVWGRFRRGIESADANLDASIENYDDVLVTLIADAAAAYVEMRAFQQRLKNARANVATQEKSLELAEARHKNGIVTKLDVTQAQSSLHQTKALVPVLERGVRQANNRLCVLLGIPPRDLSHELGNTGEEKIPVPPEQVVVGIPADLIRRRPDVRRAEREVAAQSALIGVAASDLFPTFTIDGTINWQATDFGDLLTPATNAGIIRPSLNWNILNYGRIMNKVAVQDARFRQLAVTYLQTVLEANREAEDAIIDFLRSRDRAEELKLAVKATAESVSLAQLHYGQGWIDFDRVDNLQQDLVIQQDESVAAQADVALGLIRVYRALGGGWQLRCEPAFEVMEEPAADGEATPLSPQPEAASRAD